MTSNQCILFKQNLLEECLLKASNDKRSMIFASIYCLLDLFALLRMSLKQFFHRVRTHNVLLMSIFPNHFTGLLTSVSQVAQNKYWQSFLLTIKFSKWPKSHQIFAVLLKTTFAPLTSNIDQSVTMKEPLIEIIITPTERVNV